MYDRPAEESVVLKGDERRTKYCSWAIRRECCPPASMSCVVNYLHWVYDTLAGYDDVPMGRGQQPDEFRGRTKDLYSPILVECEYLSFIVLLACYQVGVIQAPHMG